MKTFRLLLALLSLIVLASPTVTCDVKAKHFQHNGAVQVDPETGDFIGYTKIIKDVITATVTFTYDEDLPVSFEWQVGGFTGTTNAPSPTTSGGTTTKVVTKSGEKMHSGGVGSGGLYSIEAWLRPISSTTTHYAHDVASTMCHIP
jgi:hypothetical protein